jgi:ParB family transcriptional regulator, chromosome partitioning protein
MAKKKVFSIGSSLSDGLEQTIVAAQNYSSALRIDVIPLRKIELDPDNPRTLTITPYDIEHGLVTDDLRYSEKSKDLESLQTLSSSICEQGLINPILVYENNGLYRLIAGERRTLASLIAKKTDIQAKILDEKPDELKIRLLQWIENIERTDLSLTERIDNLEKIISAFAKQKNIDLQKVRITDISKLIGCTKSHAISLKAVLNADPDIKKLIVENKIRNLEKAALLTSIESPELRERAITQCLQGATLKKLKLYLEKDKPQDVNNIKDSDSFVIHLGSTTNVQVAKIVFDAIVSDESFKNTVPDFNARDIDNPKALSHAFKQLIKKLEEVHE